MKAGDITTLKDGTRVKAVVDKSEDCCEGCYFKNDENGVYCNDVDDYDCIPFNNKDDFIAVEVKGDKDGK